MVKRRSGLSGADNEAGGQFRASVAALVLVRLLRGFPIPEFDFRDNGAVPLTVLLEGDEAVDDIVVHLAGDRRVYLQAKRTLNLSVRSDSKFGKAVAQWQRLAEEDLIDPARERVVIVARRLGRPLSELAKALERGRWSVAAGRSEREQQSFAKLSALLGGLPGDQRDRLLTSALILGLDVERDDSTRAVVAQQELEAGVVEAGHGLVAWQALCDACRRRAAQRRGFDLDDALQVLRNREVPLVADRDGVASAQRLAEQAAISIYRQRVNARGSSLDLTGLGLALPDIPLAEADAVTRVARSDGQPTERQLTWSLRRHGRLLLTGLPGGGKSTTLRASAADYARRGDWPLPVYAKLTDLARSLDGRDFQQALFHAATPALDLNVEDLELVRGVYQRVLREGQIALFLDALDETRQERFATVQRIARFLDEAHPDIEVVVATREVAYADAKPLQFRDVEVSSPRVPEHTTERILEEAAIAAEVPFDERENWVTTRQRWVHDVLERDHTLTRTPLIPVVLAVLAATHDRTSLPATRAKILRMVMQDVVRGWEAAGRRAGRVSLGGVLADQRAVEALTRSFPTIGRALIRDRTPDRSEVEGLLRRQLADDFYLSSVDAEIVSRELLAFWDEAGVFVVDSAGGIAARLQLFAETAAAISIAGLVGDDLNAAVSEAADDPDQSEALKLAMGLSTGAADALWRSIETNSDVEQVRRARLLAGAVAEGAVLAAEQRFALARILADEIQPGRPSDAWWIARLGLAGEQAYGLAQQVEQRLDPSAQLIFRALTAIHWDRSAPEVSSDLRALLEADSIRIGRSLTIDDGYAEAMVGAAELLRDGSDGDQQAIEAGLGKASMGVDQKLSAILIDIGRGDAVSAYQRKSLGRLRISDWLAHEARADRLLLDLLAQVAEPTQLSYRQERRLDELCDLMETLGIPDAAGAEVSRSVARAHDEVMSLLRNVAPLTGIDVSIAATQAELVRQLLETDDGVSAFGMLFDDGQDRGFRHWENATDHRHLRNALRAHMAGWRWLAVAAASAYSATSDRGAATEELSEVLDDYENWNRWLAAKVLLTVDPHPLDRARGWMASNDVIKRQVAAEVVAHEIARVAEAEVLACLDDGDEGVRASAYKQLSPTALTPSLRERAWRELTGEPTAWQCLRCGRRNTANSSGCAECSTSGPDAARAARELLSAAGEEVPDLTDYVHRHVKVIELDEFS